MNNEDKSNSEFSGNLAAIVFVILYLIFYTLKRLHLSLRLIKKFNLNLKKVKVEILENTKILFDLKKWIKAYTI